MRRPRPQRPARSDGRRRARSRPTVSRATRGPMRVTMSCSMVAAQPAQSRRVGSPSSPGPNRVAISPGPTPASPTSSTTWSIDTVPTIGTRRPRSSTVAPASVAESEMLRGIAVGVSERQQREPRAAVGAVRAGRTRHRCRRSTSRTAVTGAREGHRAAQLDACATGRCRTARRRSAPCRSGCSGSVIAPAVAARCATAGAEPAVPGDAQRVAEQHHLPPRLGSPGSSARARWLITPTTSRRPCVLAEPGELAQRRPLAAVDAVARHPGVEVQVDAGAAAGAHGRGRTPGAVARCSRPPGRCRAAGRRRSRSPADSAS